MPPDPARAVPLCSDDGIDLLHRPLQISIIIQHHCVSETFLSFRCTFTSPGGNPLELPLLNSLQAADTPVHRLENMLEAGLQDSPELLKADICIYASDMVAQLISGEKRQQEQKMPQAAQGLSDPKEAVHRAQLRKMTYRSQTRLHAASPAGPSPLA